MENIVSGQVCVRCVMNTSDPTITFDRSGTCFYCRHFDEVIAPEWQLSPEASKKRLASISELISRSGSGREFDCIIGLSGGLDSSYTAYVAVKEMGLRPLLVHVDAGWNTDQAVSNIERLVDGLGLELYTDVVNWDSVKRMQVAFLRAGIPDQDLVQDAAFFSSLYKFAREFNVQHILTGSNFSTECCREPEAWGGYLGIDKRLFNDIWIRHGDGKPVNFPLVDILTYKIIYPLFRGIRVHHPLNATSYIKSHAEAKLRSEFGWQPFQHKHHESRFTRFYEDYWLPRRFGFDKRRAHFSSLIMTGQMTRTDALERLSRAEMSEQFLSNEFEYIAEKLDLGVEGLRELFELPLATYRSYKNKRWVISIGARGLQFLGRERRRLP
jgi:N-acetyl sugar amidotransferase